MAERCRWHTDKETGERYHVPGCYGGLHNPAGCYCKRSAASRDAYEREEDDVQALEDRIAALEAQVAGLSDKIKA